MYKTLKRNSKWVRNVHVHNALNVKIINKVKIFVCEYNGKKERLNGVNGLITNHKMLSEKNKFSTSF